MSQVLVFSFGFAETVSRRNEKKFGKTVSRDY